MTNETITPEPTNTHANATVPLYPADTTVPPAAPYGAAQTAPAAPAAAAPKTNLLGILTLVFGILGFGIVPVITGHIALSQIKKTGEEGRGLTLAGLILGYVTVAGWVLVALFWIAIVGFSFLGHAASGYAG